MPLKSYMRESELPWEIWRAELHPSSTIFSALRVPHFAALVACLLFICLSIYHAEKKTRQVLWFLQFVTK